MHLSALVKKKGGGGSHYYLLCIAHLGPSLSLPGAEMLFPCSEKESRRENTMRSLKQISNSAMKYTT